MIIKSFIGAACICLAVVSFNSNAVLIGVDDSSMDFLGAAQDGWNITLDTSTNLQWLDWSLTTSRSYNDVYAQTQGGTLDGWRYATSEEFAGLATAAGIPASFLDATPGGTDVGFTILNSLLGDTGDVGLSSAISAWSNSPGTHTIGGFTSLQNGFDVPNDSFNIFNNEFLDVNSFNLYGGSALVRVNPVPVPASVWLFGSGLIGLVGFAKRKKA